MPLSPPLPCRAPLHCQTPSLPQLVKTLFGLLCLLSIQVCSHAQNNAETATPAAVPPPTDVRTEMMLRRLREAMTNPPPKSQNEQRLLRAPEPAPTTTTSPTPTVPPSAQAPGQTMTVPDTSLPAASAPVTRPTVAPAAPAATNQPAAGVLRENRTTVVTPALGQQPIPQIPPTRGYPGRAQPQMNLPAVQETTPGQAPAPGVALPGAVMAQTRPAAASPVAPNLDPNEIIGAGLIHIQGMEADQFFEIYSQISGRTVLRPYTLPNLQKITLKAATDLTRQEAVFAMDSVMSQNLVAMIPIGDKFVKAVPSQTAAQEGAPPSSVDPVNYADAEPFITQVVTLKVVKPTDLQQLLSTFSKSPQGITPFDATQTIVLRDYASNVKRMLEVIKTVDVPPKEPDYHLEAIPVKYGKVIDLYNTMQALISGGGAPAGGTATGQSAGQVPFGRSGGASRYGGTANRYGGQNYGGYGGGYGNYGGGYGRSYGGYGSGSMYPYDESIEKLSPMQATPATPTTSNTTTPRTSVGGAQSSFQNRLNQIVRRAASGGASDEVPILEDARIVPDERSNKLLVFANKRDMDMITNIVSKVDVLLAQVLIEAVIMEVRLGDSQKLGVSWAQRPKAFGGGSSGAGAINSGPSFLNSLTNFPGGAGDGFSYFGTINNQFDVAINAFAENSSVNVISRPRIQTSHAIPGSFFVGETVPYITGFTDYGGLVGSGVATRSVVQQANVGFSLFVTPFITPDGLVVMEISQEFSTRGRDVTIDDNPVPIINGRNADSTLTVRDGDTIMMGGFITENRSKGKSGVPYLKDIPGLGVLFRSKNHSNDRTELIVLMRARVLRSPEEAAIIAAEEKSDLPGIYQAEQDFQSADQKRKEKAAKVRH